MLTFKEDVGAYLVLAQETRVPPNIKRGAFNGLGHRAVEREVIRSYAYDVAVSHHATRVYLRAKQFPDAISRRLRANAFRVAERR